MAYSLTQRASHLDRAAQNLRVVRITYIDVKGEQTTRDIAVDEIRTSKDGNAYAKVFCFLRGECRSIRLDRIISHRTTRRTWSVENLEMAA